MFNEIHQVPQKYLRVPRSGDRCPITGLCRSSIWNLISGPTPRVSSKTLRRAGARRGIRLVETQSLLDYIRGAEEPSLGEDEQVYDEQGLALVANLNKTNASNINN